jgi:hypothetical protein
MVEMVIAYPDKSLWYLTKSFDDDGVWNFISHNLRFIIFYIMRNNVILIY